MKTKELINPLVICSNCRLGSNHKDLFLEKCPSCGNEFVLARLTVEALNLVDYENKVRNSKQA